MQSRTGGALAGLLVTIGAFAPATVHAASAPDAGTAFEPTPLSQPLYGVKPPTADPKRQQRYLRGADGVRLYVETYLPAARNGRRPPERVPTILIATPYEDLVNRNYAAGRSHRRFADMFARHGYAVALAHLRGTGRSGGCFDFHGPSEQDDVARMIEYLGRDAPWANGRVGMWGVHIEGGPQYAAATSPDTERTKYLRAIVPMAGPRNWYDGVARDGVPYLDPAGAAYALYYGTSVALPGPPTAEQPQRASCASDVARGFASDGDFTRYWQDRELRRGAGGVKAAVLFSQGLYDLDVTPFNDVGFFDRMSADTPVAGVIGQWEHQQPDRGNVQPDWRRVDWRSVEHAWFDRYLMDLQTGADAWPRMQVQDSGGQWRVEPMWPTTGGPVGHLALGPAGSLGATEPHGTTQYREQPYSEAAGLGGAVFETPAVGAPLHLTGQPSLELWVVLEDPDAHVAANLELLDADGRSVLAEPVHAVRSARHLDPLVEGRFEQATGKPAPVGTPLRIPLRMTPLDAIVPVGGKLRLTVSGSAKFGTVVVPVLGHGYSQPSGRLQAVRILHDCTHTSVLRFLMPRENAELLNVREPDEPVDQPLASNPDHALEVDGGGIATAPVCGRAPERDEVIGPARWR